MLSAFLSAKLPECMQICKDQTFPNATILFVHPCSYHLSITVIFSFFSILVFSLVTACLSRVFFHIFISIYRKVYKDIKNPFTVCFDSSFPRDNISRRSWKPVNTGALRQSSCFVQRHWSGLYRITLTENTPLAQATENLPLCFSAICRITGIPKP